MLPFLRVTPQRERGRYSRQKKQKFLRECFLSPNIDQEKSINHGEHGVHGVFLRFFSVISVNSVVKKPLRNNL
jgi:hypothetical protein